MTHITSGEGIEWWVCDQVGKRWIPGAGHALGWLKGDELVAGVYFSNYDGANVVLDVAAKPKSRWLNRVGLWAIFNYAFEQLGCVRATAFVPESNDLSRKLVEQGGFELEGRMERAAPGGEAMLIYRMFADKCPWLKREEKNDESDNRTDPDCARRCDG